MEGNMEHSLPIISSYRINEKTLYLRPYVVKGKKAICTYVVETNNQFIVNNTPMNILKLNSRLAFDNYGAVFKQSKQTLSSGRMIPLVMSIHIPITVFPVGGQVHKHECTFIINERINRVLKTAKGCDIIFWNQTILKLDVEKSLVLRQRTRSYTVLGSIIANKMQTGALPKLA